MNSLRIAWLQAWAGIRKRGPRNALILIGVAFGVGFVACTRIEYLTILDRGLVGEESERRHWFSLVALAMTVIGVGNAMAISVAERIREIGTLKCLGASDRLVAGIYFLESLVLGIVGSAIGASMGSALAFSSTQSAWSWPRSLEAAGIGIVAVTLSALIPSLVAARMQPVEAMRTEV